MIDQEILGEFLSLPTEDQSQVISLIAFLKQKYLLTETNSAQKNIELLNHDFIGIWCDRQDLGSTNWVQSLRETEW